MADDLDTLVPFLLSTLVSMGLDPLLAMLAMLAYVCGRNP
jgi:hypothetical protein